MCPFRGHGDLSDQIRASCMRGDRESEAPGLPVERHVRDRHNRHSCPVMRALQLILMIDIAGDWAGTTIFHQRSELRPPLQHPPRSPQYGPASGMNGNGAQRGPNASDREVIMTKTVSDFFWERISAWGIKRIFGYPGDGINGLVGALDRARDRFEFVQARHEAAFTASAHAKFTGDIGVCLATSGRAPFITIAKASGGASAPKIFSLPATRSRHRNCC